MTQDRCLCRTQLARHLPLTIPVEKDRVTWLRSVPLWPLTPLWFRLGMTWQAPDLSARAATLVGRAGVLMGANRGCWWLAASVAKSARYELAL